MNKEDLFSYITEGRVHAGITAFKSWIESSDNFFKFVLMCSDKIRRKIRGAKAVEDLVDVLFEL